MGYWARGAFAERQRRRSSAPSGPLLWSALYPGDDPAGEVHLHQSVVIDRDITIEGMMVHQHEGQPAPTVSLDPARSVLVESSGSIAVHDGATLQMRPSGPSVVHEIRFIGVDEQAFIGGGGANGAPMDHGDYPDDVGLWVEGALDWVGHERCPWTRAAGSIAAAATSCVVEDATGWQVGDVVTITPTLSPLASEDYLVSYDERTLTSITLGAGTQATVGFSALTYAHPQVTFDGYLDGDPVTFNYPAEVINLTRNVRVGGTDGGRSHIMVHPSPSDTPVTVENVALRWMGPQTLDESDAVRQILGRYPFHFHFAGASRTGSTLRNIVSYDFGLRSFVTHATHNITWERCVAHRGDFTPFWWDTLGVDDEPDGPDSNNVFYDRCVGSMVGPSSGHTESSAMLLNQGEDTAAHGCVMVSVRGRTGAAGYQWPEDTNDEPHIVWDFRDCTAHNCQQGGVFVWQNDSSGHSVVDSQFYNNGIAGVTHGAYLNSYTYQDVTCFSNGEVGLYHLALPRDLPGDPLTMRRCTFNADGAPYAVETADHAQPGVQAAVYEDCWFGGHATAAWRVNSSPSEEKDWFHLIDPTFDGLEASWFWLESTMHPDGVIEVEFIGGDHYELHRDDWPSGTFVADWNAMRVDL